MTGCVECQRRNGSRMSPPFRKKQQIAKYLASLRRSRNEQSREECDNKLAPPSDQDGQRRKWRAQPSCPRCGNSQFPFSGLRRQDNLPAKRRQTNVLLASKPGKSRFEKSILLRISQSHHEAEQQVPSFTSDEDGSSPEPQTKDHSICPCLTMY